MFPGPQHETEDVPALGRERVPAPVARLPADQPARAPIAAHRGQVRPCAPRTLLQSGLSRGLLRELVGKQLYFLGRASAGDLAGALRLPESVVLELLCELADARCIRPANDRFSRTPPQFELTEAGRHAAYSALSVCRYTGPAPVSCEEFAAVLEPGTSKGVAATAAQLDDGLRGLVAGAELRRQFGAALAAGGPLLLSGRPGVGKTTFARRLAAVYALATGPTALPEVLAAGRRMIALRDPAVHRPGEPPTTGDGRPALSRETLLHDGDARWRSVRPPVVVCENPFDPELFALRRRSESTLLEAPAIVRAARGVLILDNLGRSGDDMAGGLERWLRVLDEHSALFHDDHGAPVRLPVSSLMILATPRPLEDLGDALRRRAPHGIVLPDPAPEEFRQLLLEAAEDAGVECSERAAEEALARAYDRKSPPSFHDPQGIIEMAVADGRFRQETPRLTVRLVDAALRAG